MEFYVYSRMAIERIAPFAEPHVFISITTTAEESARLPTNEHTLGVLRLAFVDRHEPPGNVFTEPMADRIVAFVETHRDRGLAAIAVHCDAGVSRSPGVAAGLARGLFAQDDADLFRRYVPNRLVYRTLLAACVKPEQTIDAFVAELGASLGPPFGAFEIAKLEELAGRPLPRAYRHFVRRWGSLLPFDAIVERSETLQSLDDGANRSHRALLFDANHAFDFRTENDFGEPAIVRYADELGVDSFPADPEPSLDPFTAWLVRSGVLGKTSS